MPRLIACRSRGDRFSQFEATIGAGEKVYMLVDSEGPVVDGAAPWAHLRSQDNWKQPNGATDEHVFFMTQCMESWIAADQSALKQHFGTKLNIGKLPPANDLENRRKQDVIDALKEATKTSKAPLDKGEVSFKLVSKLDPDTLEKHLPSFERMKRILDAQL